MKQVLTFLSIVICIPLLHAQEIETAAVPSAVMDQFTLLYPDARNISWEITNEDYRADFKNDKMSTMAMLAADGSLLRTETEIKIIALPETATTFLQEKFPDKKIDKATILEDKTGVITFGAILEKVDLTFDCTGQILATNEVVLAGYRNR